MPVKTVLKKKKKLITFTGTVVPTHSKRDRYQLALAMPNGNELRLICNRYYRQLANLLWFDVQVRGYVIKGKNNKNIAIKVEGFQCDESFADNIWDDTELLIEDSIKRPYKIGVDTGGIFAA